MTDPCLLDPLIMRNVEDLQPGYRDFILEKSRTPVAEKKVAIFYSRQSRSSISEAVPVTSSLLFQFIRGFLVSNLPES